MTTETKKFDNTNTIVLNKNGENYSAKINVNGQSFEATLQKQKSKIGTTYIFWRDGENSLYLFDAINKTKLTEPDMSGNLQWKNTEYKVALWNKFGISKKNGKPYDFFSGSIRLPQPTQTTENNDDLPF